MIADDACEINNWEIIFSCVEGLGYIESNIAAADDDKQLSSIGFDIIFSHLIERAQSLDLNLPLGGNVLEKLIQNNKTYLR